MAARDSGRLKISRADYEKEMAVISEIDALRPRGHHKQWHFTPEQDAALLAARSGPMHQQVHWGVLCAWWREKWGAISQDTLRSRLRELQAQRKEA